MKVLLYLENKNSLANSGIGRAITHQSLALKENGIEYTYDPKDSFDIAHINSYQFRSYHLMRKYQKKGLKVIVHGHSTHEDFKDSFRMWRVIAPFYNFMLNRMYKKADYIITPTPYSKGLIENYKGVKCPVKAISNGINLSEYKPNEEYIKMFKEKFDIKEGQKVVIGVGWYFKRKGIDDFCELARKFPEVTFIWFGHLSKILTPHSINKCLKNRPSNMLLPGYIKGEIIKGAYQYASCMLFPSREETEGIVSLEALATYCPLVVRDIKVYDQWLENKKNCLMCRNEEDFINAINLCLNNDMSEMTKEGYKVAEKRDLKNIGAELKKTYLEVLDTKTK